MVRTAVMRQTMLVFGMLLIASVSASFVSLRVAHAAGTTYYIATNGNDNNIGTSTSSPFQHIQKCASIAVAGDSCLIEGGTYHETVTPAHSGTSSAPITFAPYNGQAVSVDGADPVTGWSLYQNNIYVANVVLPVSGETVNSATTINANQVFVNGQMVNEVRWPASSSIDLSHPVTSTAGSESTGSTIYDSNLPNLDWTGAVVHWIATTGWVSQTGIVSSYTPASGSTAQHIAFGASECCEGVGVGVPYYLTGGKNGVQEFNSASEWWYDWTNHKLYLWTPNSDNPTNYTVEARQRLYGFDLSGLSYITIQHMELFSASVLTSTASSNNTLNGLTVDYVSHFLTTDRDLQDTRNQCYYYCSHTSNTGIILAGSNETLENSTLAYSAGDGVTLLGDNLTVTNNLLHDMDYIGSYNAAIKIQAFTAAEVGSATITHNTIYNTGRDGLQWENNVPFTAKDQISYNNIYNYGIQTSDLGGIYICCSTINGNATSIDHNWTHDAIAANANGIYIDNSANNFVIHHNTVWNTTNRGVTLNGSGGDGSTNNNLVYNNTMGPGLKNSIGGQSKTATGTQIINNVYSYGSKAIEDLGAGATIASNFMPLSPSTLFADTTNHDYHLKPNAPAIDQGQVIAGITDGYVGSAPDVGAYEYGGTDWAPGCNFSNCGTNFVFNGGFESGTLNSWCSGGGAYCTNGSVTFPSVHNGSTAGQVTGAGSTLQQVITGLSPSTMYILSAYGEVDTSGDQLWIGAQNYAGSGSDTHQVVAGTTYTPVTLSFTTGSADTSATIYLTKQTGSGSGYGDDFVLAKNLVQNPGFETGTTSGWCNGGGTYCTNNSVITTHPHSGTYNGQVSTSGADMEQSVSGLSISTSYTLTAWAAAATAGEQVEIGAKAFLAGNGGGVDQIVTSMSYSQVSMTFATDASTTSTRISLYKASGAGVGYGDDYVLTANNQNLIANPGFESGSLGSWCNSGATCNGDAAVFSQAHTGTYAAKLGGLHADLEQYITGLQPNTSYTLTAWGKVAIAGEQLQIGAKAYSGSAGVYQTLTSTSYTQVTVTFTTGSTNTSARITLYKATGSGVAYGDDYTLTPTAS